MTAAPPSRSMEVTKMLVRMQKKKKVMCAGLPQRASAQERCMISLLACVRKGFAAHPVLPKDSACMADTDGAMGPGIFFQQSEPSVYCKKVAASAASLEHKGLWY